MMRARKRRGRRPGERAPAAMISFRDRPAGAARRARARAARRDPARGARSPSSRAGPKGWTVGAAFQATELYDAVDLRRARRTASTRSISTSRPATALKTLAQHHPPAGRGAGAGLPPRGRGPPARRLRLPGARGRAPARARRHLLLDPLSPAARPTVTCCSPRSSAACGIPTSPTPTCRPSPRGCRTTCGRCSAPRASRPSAPFHLWPKAIPQYDLTYGRFKDIMDEAERRNPGFALAGSYREGVAVGEAIASGGGGGRARSPARCRKRGATREPRRSGSARAAARSRSGRPSTCGPGSTPPGYETERVEIRTTGDMVQHVPLAQIGAPRAVHPTDRRRACSRAGSISRCTRSRICRRRCRTGSRSWRWASGRIRATRWWAAGRSRGTTLPQGAVLATSSLRRRAQLLHVRPDLAGPRHPRQRGHPARQARRERRVVAAILLAAAGLVRLGLGGPHRPAAAAGDHAAGAGPGRAGASPRAPATRRGGRRRAGGPPRGRPRSPSPRSARSSARSKADVRCRWRRSRRSREGSAPAARAGRVAWRRARGRGHRDRPVRRRAARPTTWASAWPSGCSTTARRRSWRRCAPRRRRPSRSPDAGDRRRHRVGRAPFRGWSRRCGRFPVAVEDAPLMTFAPPLDWAPVDARAYATSADTARWRSPRHDRRGRSRSGVATRGMPAAGRARTGGLGGRRGHRAGAGRRRSARSADPTSARSASSGRGGGAARRRCWRLGRPAGRCCFPAATSGATSCPPASGTTASRSRRWCATGRCSPARCEARARGGAGAGARGGEPERRRPARARLPAGRRGRRCWRWARPPRRRRAPRAGRPPAVAARPTAEALAVAVAVAASPLS